jgi:hypothetical protein
MYEVYVDTKIFPCLVLETTSLHKATTKFNELVASYKNDPVWKSDEEYEVLDVQLVQQRGNGTGTILSHWQVSRAS